MANPGHGKMREKYHQYGFPCLRKMKRNTVWVNVYIYIYFNLIYTYILILSQFHKLKNDIIPNVTILSIKMQNRIVKCLVFL